MIADLVDRFDRLPDWSRRVLGIVGAAWMVVTALDYGRIIDLPEIPVLTGTAGIILAGLYIAVWWGFINPRIEQHRAARCSAAEAKVTVNG